MNPESIDTIQTGSLHDGGTDGVAWWRHRIGDTLAQLGRNVPRAWHLALSRTAAAAFESRTSAIFIGPYCRWKYGDPDYWQKFEPGSSGSYYRSFQDFFTRNLVAPLVPTDEVVWPCEGLLCQAVPYSDMDSLRIKGEWMRASRIFALQESWSQVGGFLYNVFLHNHNYHHIHSPVSGRVTRVVRIPGKLFFLRPWAYEDPSFPALRNERVVIDIEDAHGSAWSLAIVGGPLVGTVQLHSNARVGASVSLCDKLATFRMGSTCCLLSPIRAATPIGSLVEVGSGLTRAKE